ncbi:hypothetical protein D4M92_21165 [Klebsiella michiganensis]|nr:hypothetical protein D4M92_21165 [Klebsiella michiganensis]
MFLFWFGGNNEANYFMLKVILFFFILFRVCASLMFMVIIYRGLQKCWKQQNIFMLQVKV